MLLSQADSSIKEYLSLKESLRSVSERVFLMPELADDIKNLMYAESYLKDFLEALPKNHTININILSEPLDFLTEGDSVFSQVRRQQARELARRLYSKVHPDVAQNPLYSLKQIRDFAKNGEMELLHLISVQLGIPQTELWDQVMEGLRAQMSKLTATPAFKLSYLYTTNRPAFLVEARKILSKKTEALHFRLMDMRKEVERQLALENTDGDV